MERLTFEVHDGGMFVKESDVKTYTVEDEIMHTGNAVRRLAEYEDFEEIFRSKMTDAACEFLKDKEEFARWLDRNKWIAKKCDEYARTEEQGKLLKLPCAVGDTVYVKMQSGGYAEAEVRDFSYFLSCGFCVVVTSDKFNKQHIPFTEFGKTVFLTKEAAEAVLKEMSE